MQELSSYERNTAALLLIYSPAEALSLRMCLCFGKTAQQLSLSPMLNVTQRLASPGKQHDINVCAVARPAKL